MIMLISLGIAALVCIFEVYTLKQKQKQKQKQKTVRWDHHDQLLVSHLDHFANIYKLGQAVYVISSDTYIGIYNVKHIDSDGVILSFLSGTTPIKDYDWKWVVADINYIPEEEEEEEEIEFAGKYRNIDAVPFADENFQEREI